MRRNNNVAFVFVSVIACLVVLVPAAFAKKVTAKFDNASVAQLKAMVSDTDKYWLSAKEIVYKSLPQLIDQHNAEIKQGLRHEKLMHGNTAVKQIAITFDDGPHPIYTPQLLDILDKYHVKATFFMIGREMDKSPDIVRDVIKRGHEIANHTYTHPHNIKADSEAQLIRELDQCEQVIERLTGQRAHLFRPPRGLIDGTVFTIAEEEGYRTILWTVSPDNRNAPTPKLMAMRVLNHIRPGAIILAHDGTFATRWKDV